MIIKLYNTTYYTYTSFDCPDDSAIPGKNLIVSVAKIENGLVTILAPRGKPKLLTAWFTSICDRKRSQYPVSFLFRTICCDMTFHKCILKHIY